jgi:hypothetical protein
MKRWVLTLCILLLPLRLWAADAMALQAVAWPEPPAQQSPCHGVAATPDYSGHAHTPEAVAHGVCLHCEICHNVLSLPPLQVLPWQLALPEALARAAAPVLSAERTPCFKPPIG